MEIIKISRNKWQWKYDISKPMRCSKSSSKTEVHSGTILPQETKKYWIDKLTLHLKQLEKEEPKNPQISRRKEIMKIWAEVNEKEMKETLVKINKTKSWFFEKINKSGKPLARLIKKKKADIQRIIWDCYEQLYDNKIDNLEEMDRILRKVQSSKTEPGRNRNYKQPNYKHWNWSSDQKSPKKQKPRTRWFHRKILSNI